MKNVLMVLLSISLALPMFATAAVKSGDVPDLAMKTADGNELKLSDLRGKVVLLDFWATWCAPCERSLPFYAELESRLGPKGLTVVAVNVDEDPEAARTFLAANPLPFTVALDPKQAIVARFEPTAMPTAYLIDKTGTVRLIHSGFRASDKKLLIKKIEKLLAE